MRQVSGVVFLLGLMALPAALGQRSSGSSKNSSQPQSFAIVSFKWDHVKDPYVITLWILVASLAKIVPFSSVRAKFYHTCTAVGLLLQKRTIWHNYDKLNLTV